MLPAFLTTGIATIHPDRSWRGRAQGAGKQGRVLVLESDDTLRGAFLSALGAVVPVIGVRSGQEALEVMDRENVSIAVTSLQPEDFEGVLLLRQIRDRLPASKVIAMSSSGAYDLVHRVTEIGVGDFLEKPFTIEDLYRSVENSMRGVTMPLDFGVLSARHHEKSRIRRRALLACA
jgi:DNA-binding NtrC family response regulator